jgi:WD40 repeat protein
VVGPAQWETCIRTVFHVAGTPALAYWNNNIAIAGPTSSDIVILDALTGSQKAVLSGHTGSVISLTYSLDGTFLVSGSNDKTIKLWDVQTGGIIKTLCGHTDWVCSVSISADDTMIASASQDKTICLWSIKKGSCCIIERYPSHAILSPSPPQTLKFCAHLVVVLCSSGTLMAIRLGL